MTAYEIPSLIALLFKLVLLGYAFKTTIKNSLTKLYMVLLVIMSLYNLVEFIGFIYYHQHGLTPTLQSFGYAYFLLLTLSIVVILHISLLLSLDTPLFKKAWPVFMLYFPAFILVYLLLFTDQLIVGFKPFLYAILRVPGPLYFLFETFAVLYLSATLVNLLYGARTARASGLRTRNRLWLLGVAPTALLFSYLVIANHFGWTHLTSTFYLPITMTFFLIVTAYATHQYRLFDIQFMIPWSKVRKRKTAFYDRIRTLIAEIADLNSTGDAVQRLAATLGCPVALFAGGKPVVAAAGSSKSMLDIPKDILQRVDQIVVANEIEETFPVLHQAMLKNGIAAIVPFYPYSKHASGWLLLGDAFSEQVYTKLDFKVVEELFDKMADLFLDKLITMRTQLADAVRQIHVLEAQHEQVTADLVILRKENETLRSHNTWLLKSGPVDSLSMTLISAPVDKPGAATLTLLGRDRTLLKQLREVFPQIAQFVGADSVGFKRQQLPDILICQLEKESGAFTNKIAALLASHRGECAVILYGPAAQHFVAANRAWLRGTLVEVIPADSNPELWVRRLQAMMALKKVIKALPKPDQPLIDISETSHSVFEEAQRIAGFLEPILIRTDDRDQGIALARWIHSLSEASGQCEVWDAAELIEAQTNTLATQLLATENGTLIITEAQTLTQADMDYLREVQQQTTRRLVAVTHENGDAYIEKFRSLVLTMPVWSERKRDIQPLIHYFTLQFNLQSGTHQYLTQTDVDSIIADKQVHTIGKLKTAVYTNLQEKARGARNIQEDSPTPDLLKQELAEKTLEEHMAEYEARIIMETIARCNGNKSKAARLLGLRPNTLHYKLERYGFKD